ncbi:MULTISPECIES: ABC transporter permease [unclassified Streptomyces]|uniref:ABC transporter permease n=1 Tax=unclassified Streptomyces TaxID=2593676 RepID=UPI00380BC427
MTSITAVPSGRPGGADPSGRRRPARTVLAAARGAAGFAALAGIYEILRATGVLPAADTAGVGSVLAAVADGVGDGSLTRATLETLHAWSLGLAVAAVIAVPLGILVGKSWTAFTLTEVVVEFLRPVPSVALVPVAVVLFGLDLTMQVFLVAFACVWPVLIQTRYSVRALDPVMLDSARTFRLSPGALLVRVVVPAATPAILTGLRTAASLGVVVAVAAEIVAGTPGLGRYLVDAQQGGHTAAAFAAVLVSGVLGLIVNAVFAAAELRLAGWQQHSTEERR